MTSPHKCQFTFIVPIYNEAKRLPISLEQIAIFSKDFKYSFEWIFVLEPSSDESLNIIKEFCQTDSRFRYIANENQKGKGYAVQTGMLSARGTWAFFMDADLATPLKEIHKFIQCIESDLETKIFIGSRKLQDSNVTKSTSLLRKILSFGLVLILKLLNLTPFNDTQCGFKAFHQTCIDLLFARLTNFGYSFDIEVLALAQKYNVKVREIGIEWSDVEASKVNPIKDSLRFLKNLILIKFFVVRKQR